MQIPTKSVVKYAVLVHVQSHALTKKDKQTIVLARKKCPKKIFKSTLCLCLKQFHKSHANVFVNVSSNVFKLLVWKRRLIKPEKCNWKPLQVTTQFSPTSKSFDPLLNLHSEFCYMSKLLNDICINFMCPLFWFYYFVAADFRFLVRLRRHTWYFCWCNPKAWGVINIWNSNVTTYLMQTSISKYKFLIVIFYFSLLHAQIWASIGRTCLQMSETCLRGNCHDWIL